MFIKNAHKILERKDFKISLSSKVRVEDPCVEITNKSGEKHIVSVIYRHPRGCQTIYRSLREFLVKDQKR